MARFPGALGLRAARTAAIAEGRLTILGVWRKAARLLIVRSGKPRKELAVPENMAAYIDFLSRGRSNR